jgi:hypothetical protein
MVEPFALKLLMCKDEGERGKQEGLALKYQN